MTARERLIHEMYSEQDIQRETEKNRYKSLTETKKGQAREIDAVERW